MTARKLNNTKPTDLLCAFYYAAFGESIHTEASALNPNEYAGYTAATMIPGLNDTDWEVIYEAVNDAVEKAAQGDPNPEEVLLFIISDYDAGPLLAVIELDGYVATDPGFWTTVRAHLISLGE